MSDQATSEARGEGREGPPKVEGEVLRWQKDRYTVRIIAQGGDEQEWRLRPEGHWTEHSVVTNDEGRKRLAAALVEARDFLSLHNRGADRLADEVAVLVRLGKLDYRNPPSSERADELASTRERIAALESEVEVARGLLDRSARASSPQYDRFHPTGCDCVGDAVRAYLAAQPAAPPAGEHAVGLLNGGEAAKCDCGWSEEGAEDTAFDVAKDGRHWRPCEDCGTWLYEVSGEHDGGREGEEVERG